MVGGADDLAYFIKRVTFKLHDTYPTPNRSMSVHRYVRRISNCCIADLDKPPFEVTETGYADRLVTPSRLVINKSPGGGNLRLAFVSLSFKNREKRPSLYIIISSFTSGDLMVDPQILLRLPHRHRLMQFTLGSMTR